jgi:hypothetical protein
MLRIKMHKAKSFIQPKRGCVRNHEEYDAVHGQHQGGGKLFPLDIVNLPAILNTSSHIGDQTRQAGSRMLQSGQKTLFLGARQWSLNLR